MDKIIEMLETEKRGVLSVLGDDGYPYLPICQGGCKAGHLGIGKVSCFLQKDVVEDLVLSFVKQYGIG